MIIDVNDVLYSCSSDHVEKLATAGCMNNVERNVLRSISEGKTEARIRAEHQISDTTLNRIENSIVKKLIFAIKSCLDKSID